MFRLTGGHWGQHVEKNIMTCTVTPLFDPQRQLAVWIDTLVRLYARGAWFCVNKQMQTISHRYSEILTLPVRVCMQLYKALLLLKMDPILYSKHYNSVLKSLIVQH